MLLADLVIYLFIRAECTSLSYGTVYAVNWLPCTECDSKAFPRQAQQRSSSNIKIWAVTRGASVPCGGGGAKASVNGI